MKRKSVKQITVIEPTAQDKGLRMLVDVRLYDNGMLTINNVPMMNDKADVAMTAAVGVFVDMMIELKLQGVARTTPEAA